MNSILIIFFLTLGFSGFKFNEISITGRDGQTNNFSGSSQKPPSAPNEENGKSGVNHFHGSFHANSVIFHGMNFSIINENLNSKMKEETEHNTPYTKGEESTENEVNFGENQKRKPEKDETNYFG